MGGREEKVVWFAWGVVVKRKRRRKHPERQLWSVGSIIV
jgi:hypothetical protein